MTKIKGIIPPMVTPFDESGEIDLNAAKEEAIYLLSQEVDGIGVGGSTGEGITLSTEELMAVTEIVKQVNKKEVPIIVGIIKNSTREAIRLGLKAKEVGADALLITPSFYHPATDRGNYEYFNEISLKVNLPIIIYNVIPTNKITPELMLELSDIDYVIGIKQVDANDLTAMIEKCGDKTKIFSACDDMLYSSYCLGACGAISALATVVPKLCVDQWQAFNAGDYKTAKNIHHKLYKITEAYSEKPFVGKIKFILNQLKRNAGYPRSPIKFPDKESKNDILKKLNDAKLIR